MKLNYIINFLLENDWHLLEEAKNFSKYKAPNNLNLPDDYCLILPNTDTQPGFDKYVEGVIDVISYLYENKYDTQDLRNYFSWGYFDKNSPVKGNFEKLVNDKINWNLAILNKFKSLKRANILKIL